MKTARNLFLGLVLLVLIYGSCYLLFCREEMLKTYRMPFPSPIDNSGVNRTLWSFFFPAFKIDVHLTVDRPAKQRLVGHWLSERPGDYLTLAKDGSCRFQLGSFKFSGDLTYNRTYQGYDGRFLHRDTLHKVTFLRASSGKARIEITGGEYFREFPHLTRAPDPAP